MMRVSVPAQVKINHAHSTRPRVRMPSPTCKTCKRSPQFRLIAPVSVTFADVTLEARTWPRDIGVTERDIRR
jgi:hypothetical protein